MCRLLICISVLVVTSYSAQATEGQFYFEFANEDKGAMTTISEDMYGPDLSDGGMTASSYLSYSYPLSANDYMTFFVDQAAHTPSRENKRKSTVQEGDRPFSSYFSLGANYRFRYGPYINQVGGRIIGVGKYGFGESILNSLHSVAGKDTYDGWQDEVDDKIGGVLEYRLVGRRFGYCQMICAELNPHTSMSLGNILNQVALGATARIGNRLPEDLGPADFSLFSKGLHYVPFNGLIWEAYAGFEGRYVAENYILEGDTKVTGGSIVDMEHLQYDFQTGVTVGYIESGYNALLSLVLINRSPEFSGQESQQLVRLGLGLHY
jgi:hypothetical protein